MAKLYTRDAGGGFWREHPAELGEDGTVLLGGAPALPAETWFTVSADLGQVNDYTAVAIVESVQANPGSTGEAVYSHDVSHLERYRGMPYPEVADRLVRLCAHLPAAPVLVIDETGVGRAVCDQLRRANPRTVWFCPITITAGMDAVAQPDGSFHVAKRQLVGAVQVAQQNHRLKVGKSLPLAPVLVKECLSFQARITSSGNVVYGVPDTSDWRNGVHDDLVLAVALGVWGAEHVPRGYVY